MRRGFTRRWSTPPCCDDRSWKPDGWLRRCQMLCLLECSIVGPEVPGNLPLMKILVVDDHALIREALQGVLKKLTRDAVILEASNCVQTMEAVASHPDISLIL